MAILSWRPVIMAWNNLTIAQKSQLMNLFRKNGVTSLSDMREMYDSIYGNQEINVDNYGNPSAPMYKDGGMKSLRELNRRLLSGGDKNTLDSPYYNNSHERAIYDHLRQRGLNNAQASGLMGNLAVESYLNADLKQINGPAYGLMQAEGSRQKAIKNNDYIYQFGSGLTPEEQKQLDYIIDKGMNTDTPGEWRYGKGYSRARDARQAFMNTDDVEEAASLIQNNYLRPSKPNSARRNAMSKYYYDKYLQTFPYNTEQYDNYMYEGNKNKDGGSIHIKPSRKGTFTAAATKHGMGVQEFASKVLANKEDYSPKMVKKAAFAKSASKWKHSHGGIKF